MWYIIYIAACVFCIVALISFFGATVRFTLKKDKKKSTITNIFMSFFGSLFSAVTILNMEPPQPNIYPLDNDTQTYSESINIIMQTDKWNIIEIYYSLDGTDPIEGSKYESAITISNSTTVCARSKFLGHWSKIVKEAYRFEKISYDDYAQLSIEGRVEYDTQEEILESEEPSENDDTEQQQSEQQGNSHVNPETNVPISTADQPNNDPSTQTTEPTSNEGLNIDEGYALMTYINQYRIEAGVGELAWDSELEQAAQNIATSHATGIGWGIAELDFWPIGRQCNGAKNAQRAVSDWITGNDYIPSEAGYLLDAGITQMGGALYYLPDGNEYGYHYFWVVCLR